MAVPNGVIHAALLESGERPSGRESKRAANGCSAGVCTLAPRGARATGNQTTGALSHHARTTHPASSHGGACLTRKPVSTPPRCRTGRIWTRQVKIRTAWPLHPVLCRRIGKGEGASMLEKHPVDSDMWRVPVGAARPRADGEPEHIRGELQLKLRAFPDVAGRRHMSRQPAADRGGSRGSVH